MMYLERSLKSLLWGSILRPSSMSSCISTGMEYPFMVRRLCLLGDLDMTSWSDSAVTVSRKDTTGSEMTMGAPFMKSSWRSFKQISRWSSPAPAMMFSPDSSSVSTKTMGSDLARRLRPSTSLGRSEAFLGCTATRTTGDTENLSCLMLWATSEVEMVPVLRRYWSTPTRAAVFPAGMSGTASTVRPIMMTVRWMFFTQSSVFLPGT
mmetsp:Transcript_4725/g.10635  ORF Transcript_4725/g.10635 Transcript_4725/m.10635 type:complete len:207 (+) Transcript_4725:95-715(+)